MRYLLKIKDKVGVNEIEIYSPSLLELEGPDGVIWSYHVGNRGFVRRLGLDHRESLSEKLGRAKSIEEILSERKLVREGI